MSSKRSSALSIPDTLLASLDAADVRHGFPKGTMMSLMQQEIGGNAKFLEDPAAYHYGLNAEGKRVAGHTGKVSTAFGPFGILESTAADPGYGVAPLKSKSLEDQVAFAGAYLAARSKDKGLSAGLAGYGEGEQYARQVVGRIPKGGPIVPETGNAPAAEAPVQLVQLPQVVQTPQGPVPVGYAAPDTGGWKEFQQAMPEPITPVALNFGGAPKDFNPLAYGPQGNEVNFRAFNARKARV